MRRLDWLVDEPIGMPKLVGSKRGTGLPTRASLWWTSFKIEYCNSHVGEEKARISKGVIKLMMLVVGKNV